MSIMINQDGNWQENFDKTWSQAIPLPLYTSKWFIIPAVQCECGQKFRLKGDYRTHYVDFHTDGKRYKRTPKGMVEL